MARVPRRRLGDGVFHVINRAHDRRFIFQEDTDKAAFLALLAKHASPRPINIYNYVIMGNHFHLSVETTAIAELSAYMGRVCALYTRYYRKRHGGAGTLWQGRFKSTLVQKRDYMASLGRYIERNPVRAGISEVAWDYPWSSARAYVTGEDDALVRVDANYLYREMGKDAESRQSCYRQYLLDERERADEELLFKESGLVIGDESFQSQALAKAGRLTARRRGPKPKATVS